MMNRYMNEVSNFYRPATFEAIMFNEPKKAMLLENYFAKQGIQMTASCVPTVNITYGIISARVTHIVPSGEVGYVGEMLAINKACESGNPVRVHQTNDHYGEIHGCRFAYAADMPISYLIEIMNKNSSNKTTIELYKKVLDDAAESIINGIQLANIKDMNRSLNKQNEALKAQNEVLKARIGELKTSIGKLFDIAYK